MNLLHLPTYKEESLLFQQRLEKKLAKNPEIAKEFNNQIFKRIEKKHFMPLSEALKIWPNLNKYQQNFSTMNYSIKSNSQTTPIRPTNNPGLTKTVNGKQTTSFNNCQFLGPNLNKNISDIVLKLRQGEFLFQNDLSNFYQCISMSEKDISLQRFWFKPGGYLSDTQFEEYVIVKLSYGF